MFIGETERSRREKKKAELLHIAVFKKNDSRTTYNVIYRDGKDGTSYVKRFNVTAVTHDREYDLTTGETGSRVLYFTANPNGEAEVVHVLLKPNPKLKKQVFDYDFSTLMVKGRQSRGNLLTRNQVHKITLKAHGESTLGGRQVWFDHDVHRLNYDGRGQALGEFHGGDLVLVVLEGGTFYTTSFDVNNHFEPNILRIEKFSPTQSGLPSFLTPTSRASLTSSGSPSNARRATAIPASSATTRPRASSCSPASPTPVCASLMAAPRIFAIRLTSTPRVTSASRASKPRASASPRSPSTASKNSNRSAGRQTKRPTPTTAKTIAATETTSAATEQTVWATKTRPGPTARTMACSATIEHPTSRSTKAQILHRKTRHQTLDHDNKGQRQKRSDHPACKPTARSGQNWCKADEIHVDKVDAERNPTNPLHTPRHQTPTHICVLQTA